MSRSSIPLGPFDLDTPLGTGGMATVWRGTHREQGVPVAVKVITAERAKKARFRAAFRNEVRAVASLEHPHIVMVLDHGEVSEEAEAAAEGALTAGSPYLAMEMASWGSLAKVRMPVRWDDLFGTLQSLLDALAHAHARGVVHRDLKPGNVLLAAPADLRPGLKVSDFGIAHAYDRLLESRDANSGTPHFMAPEQFLGQWRDYGPWTDLYAVGCVAYTLAEGRMPYEGGSAVQLAWSHLNRPLPSLESAHVPDAFEGWIHRLMQKEPRARFRRAADAAWALSQIERPKKRSSPRPQPTSERVTETDRAAPDQVPTQLDPRDSISLEDGTQIELSLEEISSHQEALAVPLSADSDVFIPTRSEVPSAAVREASERPQLGELATIIPDAPKGLTLPWLSDVVGQESDRRAPVRALSIHDDDDLGLRPRLPPLPHTWRRPAGGMVSMPLVGAGLGLYGLRAVPMVDRDRERDRIWAGLAQVREKKRAFAIVLRGAAGNGKSRIVEWMSQRADEVGSAIVMKAVCSAIPGPSHGLPRMVTRHLRCLDLPRDKILARTERVLRERSVSDAYEWRALTELMAPGGKDLDPDGAPSVQFSNRQEQHVLVQRFVERLSRERPVLMWIEDAHWGSDALSFALHLLRAQASRPHPVLLLLTVRDELLDDRPVELGLLEELEEDPGCETLRVPPLDAEDQRRLVRELLVLEEHLADEVASRTDGNPLFAIQLVGDWVERGVLEIGDSGFVLQAHERAVLPDDIHDLWRDRIQRVLVGQPPSARVALELAAVLGDTIDEVEWTNASAELGIEIPTGLVGRLTEHRLAVRWDGGWSFTHGMLRESIERSSRERGRYEEHHRASARMLAMRYGPEAPGVPERLGRHYLAAQELARSLDPLMVGAEERLAKSEFAEAMALVEAREDALGRLGAVASSATWGEGWILRARIHTEQGRYDAAMEVAQRAETTAREHGWSTLLPEALTTLAEIEYQRGAHVSAIRRFEEARLLYQGLENAVGVADCLVGVGQALYRTGDLDRAESYHQRALARYESVDHAPGIANGLFIPSMVAMWRGDLDRALALLTRQLDLLESLGNQQKIARCLTALGEVARQAGDLDTAERRYRRSLTIDEAIGSSYVWMDRLNLGLVLIAREELDEARVVIEAVRQDLGDAEPNQAWAVHCELLPILAHAGEWEDWDAHLERAGSILIDHHLADGDAAWLLGLAGDYARRADEPVRASRAYALAANQWRGLGRADKAEEALRRSGSSPTAGEPV